jgi:hypothetical protein
MQGSYIRTGLAVIVLCLGSVHYSAAAFEQPGTRAVPFKGDLEGVVTRTPLSPSSILVEISASGHATHLGRFTLEMPHTVNLATASATGTMTFTAANGDVLTATFNGQAQVGPIVSIVEEATIMGGTGRFAGATGTFTMNRLFDPAAGTTTGSFEGTIGR